MNGETAPPDAGERLIVTGASAAFADSLLALIGSLNCNWPTHPPVRVYDLGLDAATLARLEGAGLGVVAVPEFCPHWRRHYTWKVWCWNDAPARDVLWMDAGIAALGPLDAVFASVARLGYFVIPTYSQLVDEASEAACRGCGVEPGFRAGKPSVAAGMIGFRKAGAVLVALKECLAAAMAEDNIRATRASERHEQALISLLLHKHLGSLVLADGHVYGGGRSPVEVPGQLVWIHRRTMAAVDLEHLARYLSAPGPPHRPLSAEEAARRDRRLYGLARTTYWRLSGRLHAWLRRRWAAAGHNDGVWPDRA